MGEQHMTKLKSDPLISLPLSEFIDMFLREDFSFPISHKYGEILEALSKDKCIIHVQWNTFDGEALHQPVVWKYKYWIDSSERWQRQKAESDRRRDEKFVFDANIKIVTKACIRELHMNMEWATGTALMIVKNNLVGGLRLLKVKLITDVKDL